MIMTLFIAIEIEIIDSVSTTDNSPVESPIGSTIRQQSVWTSQPQSETVRPKYDYERSKKFLRRLFEEDIDRKNTGI